MPPDRYVIEYCLYLAAEAIQYGDQRHNNHEPEKLLFYIIATQKAYGIVGKIGSKCNI